MFDLISENDDMIFDKKNQKYLDVIREIFLNIIEGMIRVFVRYSFRHFNKDTHETHPKHKHINLQKDYYKTLEINTTANQTQIKKSYFRLAKIWHPDINSKGHNRFTEIQEAYNILSNEQSRDYYDNNNQFNPKSGQTHNNKQSSSNQKQSQKQDINYRNQAFYQNLRKNKYQNFDEQQLKQNYYKNSSKQQKQRKQEENSEAAKERKKYEDEANILRQKLFTRNPIWQRANAQMNYQQRERIIQQKNQELSKLFPRATKNLEAFRKWLFRQ